MERPENILGAYDPTWLVQAAREFEPDDTALHEALSQCTLVVRATPAYIYFVSAERPNQLGSEWQHSETIVLGDSRYGEVAIDVLKDGRAGGVEFLDWIPHV